MLSILLPEYGCDIIRQLPHLLLCLTRHSGLYPSGKVKQDILRVFWDRNRKKKLIQRAISDHGPRAGVEA